MSLYSLSSLTNIIECTIKRTLLGEYTAYIKGVYDNQFSNINGRDYIVIGSQSFIVIEPTKSSTGGKRYFEAELWHKSYELIDFPCESFEVTNKPISEIAAKILNGTSFSVVTDVIRNVTFKYEPSSGIGNCREALMQLINQEQLEIDFDNSTVYIKGFIGSDKGVVFEYRKDLKGVKLKEDLSVQVTRVIPIGKDGLNISSINDGKGYIDSDNVSRYPYPITKSVPFDTEDKAELRQKGFQYLEQYKNGAISIDVDVINYAATIEGGRTGLLNVGIGDSVGVFHAPLGVNIKSRVISLEYDALRYRNLKVSLDNIVDINSKTRTFAGITEALASNVIENTDTIAKNLKTKAGNIIDKISVNQLSVQRAKMTQAVIMDLTVNHLQTLMSNAIDNEGDFLNYVDAQGKYIKWITAKKNTDLPQIQQQDIEGNSLYWTDETKNEKTTDDTNLPVMMYQYDYLEKLKIYFDTDDSNAWPVVEFGAGDLEGENKGYITKTTEGFYFEYVDGKGSKKTIALKTDGFHYLIDDVEQSAGILINEINVSDGNIKGFYNNEVKLNYELTRINGKITNITNKLTGDVISVNQE